MNVCNFVGRVANDLVVTEVGTTKVLNFNLVIDEIRKEEKIPHFFALEIWDTGAETVAKYVKKGDQLGVTCTARTQKWEKDGVKREKTVFRVDKFHLLNNKKAE